jgi:WD40 repeat protein
MVAGSPDGQTVAIVRFFAGRGAGQLDLHAADTGHQFRTLTDAYLDRAEPFAWSPDGTVLAGLAHRRLAVFAEDGRRVAEVVNEGRQALSCLAFEPTGRFLLVGCLDGTVRVYAPSSGAVLASYAWPVDRVRSVAVSPDGTLAAAGGDKGQVVVWDVDV